MRHGGDRRGSAKSRRSRKVWLLDTYGDGTHAPCAHCDVPLDYSAVEADRIEPGGSYKRDNVQPACRRCNAQRSNNLSWIPATIPQDNPNQQET